MVAPLIAVPGRFSRSASALRYEAVVNARALLEAVVRAGGEPRTLTPRSRSQGMSLRISCTSGRSS